MVHSSEEETDEISFRGGGAGDIFLSPIWRRFLAHHAENICSDLPSLHSSRGWDYSRWGQRRELWYKRTISSVEPRTRSGFVVLIALRNCWRS
jgi:hypothetical protein